MGPDAAKSVMIKLGAEDLNTYIGIFESSKIIYDVNDRIKGDLKSASWLLLKTASISGSP